MPFKPPAEITKAAIAAGCTKCTTTWDKLLILAFLAGAYIAFGGLLAEIVVGGMSGGFVQTMADGAKNTTAIPTGILKFATGAVFPVGLMCVVIAGSELFTGNCMFAPISWLDKKITLKGFAINWTLVYIGNLIGALFVVYFLAYWSGLFSSAPFGTWAMTVANGKLGLTWDDALLRGIGCNWLVCLAVWLAIASDDIVGKILGIWFPIMAFVAIGFEHSVANMFFIPLGIALFNDGGLSAMKDAWIKALGTGANNYAGSLTTDWTHFIVNNLIPVTIGNIIGAVIFVAAIYWWVYIRSPLCIATPAAPAAAPAK
jgi:formate/nitrite transporter